MRARFHKFLTDIAETFWLLPAAVVLAGIALAACCLALDRSGLLPHWLVRNSWLYSGGGTGARTLLGAVASSTIGVAGTVFSITIAALSLAAGQMGPRLLRNFTRDRGNQLTLGIFLGTFAYALAVLRSVREQGEGDFVPHLALTVSIALSLVCVATLVFFVGHMANRINVDTVVGLVDEDLRKAIRRLTLADVPPDPPDAAYWAAGDVVSDGRHGYLQQLDHDALADWAASRRIALRLLVRPGDFVFPGAPVAVVRGDRAGVEAAIRDATALGPTRNSEADLEFSVRQLVEVGVRALSPGINDPHTAMAVLDRLGAALCQLVPRHLPSGVSLRDGWPALVVPDIDYDGLADAMFHPIRQNAAANSAVPMRMLEVLTAIAGIEQRPERVKTLCRHAGLVLGDGARNIATSGDLADLRQRHARFETVRRSGVLALVAAPS